MRPIPTGLILALFLLSGGLQGCRRGDEGGNTPAAAANRAVKRETIWRTNVEELGMLVNVPYEAEEVVWREDANTRKVIAVLRFSNMDAARIVAEAEKVRPSEAVVIQSESGFPAELIAQGQMSGDDTLKGTAYAANEFLQEPYTEGRITRIGNTPYFVLELSAK